MNPDEEDYVRKLSSRLREFAESLEDDAQRDLLAGILAVAHGLNDDTTEPPVKRSALGFKDAFDPLPADKVRMILEYRSDSPSSMIVHSEPVNPNPQGDLVVGSGTVVDPDTPIVFEEG